MASPATSICPWSDTSPLQVRTRLLRLFFRCAPPGDRWTKVAQEVNWPHLVRAAPADFRPYFSGRLRAEANTLAGVCDWLFGCEYRPDKLVGNGGDQWAHPLQFERERKGDCEDYALWAWRRLSEIGYAAEFVVGLLDRRPEQLTINHAWVHVYDHRQLWLCETTATRRDLMLIPLEMANARYIPTASIDHQFRTYWYANLFHVRAYRKAWIPPRVHVTPPAFPLPTVEATQANAQPRR